jgi:long-chain acyl-CoA synthetase
LALISLNLFNYTMSNQSIWQKSYEAGVPVAIDPQRVVPLVEYLTATAQSHPEASAFTNFGTTIEYAELDRLSRKFSSGLAKLFQLNPKDRVAIMLPNVLQYPVAMFGILRAGMTVVNVNPLYTQRELRGQLQDSGARAIIVLENFASVLEQVIEDTVVEHVIVARVGDCLPPVKGTLVNAVLKHVKKAVPAWHIPNAVRYPDFMTAAAGHPQQDYSSQLDDVAFLQYTGGTTGLSKGAILTHRNVSSNVQQGLAWCAGRFDAGNDVAITALPLYHIFALTANLLFMVATAGHCVLITNPRDIKGFVKELRYWQMTYITGVNTLYQALLNAPDIERIDFSKLKIALGAGMAVTKPVARRWFELTDKPLLEVYGLSETSPAVCMNRLDLEEFNGFIGLPIPSTDVRIASDAGEPLAIREQGELCVKGPQVMQGYWQNAEATRGAFTPDGFFRTGDIATMDEQGYIKLHDRKKDMILVSGFNVYPNEIEDIVSEHPGVQEVAAVGVIDQKSGQRVKLYVVKGDSDLDQERLIEWCQQNMTNYKVPTEVEFRDELPKSAVGKILRRALRPVDTG